MEKVESIDFKTGEPITPEAGQTEKEEAKAEEVVKAEVKEAETEQVEAEKEDVESLPQWAKDRLSKVEEEKENYKKGMLKYKEKTLKTETEPEKEEEEVYPDWDENSKKFQQQTLTAAEKRAEVKAQAIVEKANEKSAIQSFISQNPELEDDAKWQEVISNYHPKNGRDTKEAIVKDLERAYILARYEKGEISQIEADALKKGEAKGKAEAQIANQASVSKTTSKSVKEGSAVSESARQLAKGLRIDPEKLAEVGDSQETSIKF